MLLAMTLWVSSALPVAEVARPGAAVQKPVVQVLLSEAEVKVDPGGGQRPFKAERGMLLQASDLVVVGPGAWVALAILGNQQVVRLDDDLALKVGELALLNAPAQPTTIVNQLDALLTTGERERTERLIGWHASPTAANTQPVRKDTQPSPPRSEPPPPPPPPPRPSGGSESVPAATVKSVPTREPQKKSDESELPPKTEEHLKRSAGPPAEAREIEPPRGELQACLEAAAPAWGEAIKAKLGKSVKVDARLKDDEVLLRLPLGLPAPACALEYFKKRGGLGPAWTSVTVPLT